MAGKEQLDRVLASKPAHSINSDINLRLEFDAPLQLYLPPDENRLATTTLPKSVGQDRPAWVSSLANHMGIEGGTVEFFTEIGDRTLAQAAKFEAAALQRGTVYQMHTQNAQNWYNIAARLKVDDVRVKYGRRRADLMEALATEKADCFAVLKELGSVS